MNSTYLTMQREFLRRVFFQRILMLLAGMLVLQACSAKNSKASHAGDSETTDDSSVASEPVPVDTALTAGCSNLFGLPRANTGIDNYKCNTTCNCDGETFTAPTYPVAFIEKLAATESTTPFDEVSGDPYLNPDAYEYLTGKVCAVIWDENDDSRYALDTFDSADDALVAGGIVTHEGQCGRCSTLYNLSVYLQYDDMTDVVRGCALQHLNSSADDNIACLTALGFDLPCAQIWYYNSKHTRELCFDPCIAALGQSYHNPDGSLNTCLQCDEDDSGTVFKAVAGRTRRNSGLPSAICRPCDDVSKVVHNYWE